MAKKKAAKSKADAKSATKKGTKHKTIGGYLDDNVENRQWFARAADCIKAGAYKFYTGHLDLDIKLMGGFPYGKLSLISGEDKSGKSTTLQRTAARMIRTCRQCFRPILDFVNFETGEVVTTCRCRKVEPMNGVYIDAEDRYDAVWGSKQGLPLDKEDPLSEHFILIKPSTGEMVTDSVRKMQQDQILDFVICDSFAALFPESREGRLAGQQQPGDSAKMLQNMLMTILHENMREGFHTGRRCTVLGAQQLRANIGSYGSPTTVPGGWFLRHGLTTHIALLKAHVNEGIDKKKMTAEGTHYSDFRGRVIKASLGGFENADVTYRVYTRDYGNMHAGDSNDPKIILEALNRFKMVQKDKTGYLLMGLPFKTIEDMTSAMNQHESLALAARYALLYNMLHADSKAYLDIDNYNYDPFYDLVIEDETEHEADGKTATLTRFKLVPRDAAGHGGQKPRGRKDQSTANEKLRQINPPEVQEPAEEPAEEPVQDDE